MHVRLPCLLSPACALAAAIQLVLEEVLLSDVHMHPYELLGWEGVFGTAFMAVALPILHVLPGAVHAASSHVLTTVVVPMEPQRRLKQHSVNVLLN